MLCKKTRIAQAPELRKLYIGKHPKDGNQKTTTTECSTMESFETVLFFLVPNIKFFLCYDVASVHLCVNCHFIEKG